MNGKIMKEIRDQVKKELEYIPKGDINQNTLRHVYFNMRMNSLGRSAKNPNDKNEILKLAIKTVKKTEKGFVPAYDEGFFKGMKE